MGIETEIAWTDSTWNPIWGCTKVDPACAHCYAETFDRRVGGAHWGPKAERRLFGPGHWAEPAKWNRDAVKRGVRRRVFCGSMCDVFEDRMPAGELAKLWGVIRKTPQLEWLLLTKRADRIASSLPADWGEGWPNVWLGVTVGTAAGLWRVPELQRVPAVVRFVSMEPLIERLPRFDLRGEVGQHQGIDWVIVGGESGGGARRMEIEWAREQREQAHAAGAAFFMKQIGGHPRKLDQMHHFPLDLQIREFPRPRVVELVAPREAQVALF
jgi:protein gp37